MRFKIFILVLAGAVLTLWHEAAAQKSVLESLTHEESIVSYLAVSNGPVYHLEEDRFIPGNIIFVDGYSLTTTDGKTRSCVVGNSSSSGYIEGQGENARFSLIRYFLQINTEEVVIADYSNVCLRLVNRTSGNTSQYVGQCGKPGKVTFGVGSKIGYPLTVIMDKQLPNHLLFSYYYDSNYYLAHFDMDKGIVSPFSTDRIYHIIQIDNGNLIFTDAQYGRVHEFNYHSRIVSYLTGSSSSGYIDGKPSSARYYYPLGLAQIDQTKVLVADANNNRIRILDLATNITSTFCAGNPKVCIFKNPQSLLVVGNSLFIGESGRVIKVQGDDAGRLPSNKLSANSSDCPKEIVKRVSDAVGFSTVDIFLADGSPFSMELPPGVYPLKHRTNNTNCSDISITVSVFDEKVVRRLAFRAEYDVKCSSIADEVSQSSLRSISNHNYGQLEEVVCQQDCKRPEGAIPMTQCDNNTLTVQWPTDITFSGGVDKVPSDVVAKFNKRLIEKGNFLYVFLLQQVPPIVYPRVTAEGASLTPELISFCTAGYTYNLDKDSCTKN